MGKMESVFKNVVQILIFTVVLSKVDSARIPGKAGISKIQEIPQYRFHYYVQDDKTEDYKPHEEYKNGKKVQGAYAVADSKGDVQIVNYRSDKSNGDQTEVNTKTGINSPFQKSLNNPIYNPQIDASKETTEFLATSPIVVEPMNTQEQKSSKSIEMDSRDEYQLTQQNVDKTIQLTEQVSTNITEDRKDDVKDEQATDQILIQDEGITGKQTEFTIPFKKPNPVNTDDFKFNDDEAMKKDIVKAIQNINGDHEQSDPQLHFKSAVSDKPLKIVSADFMEMEHQESYQPGHRHSNFKSQQLSNKPLRLFGYNPSTFGSLYDLQIDYNRPSQIQQPPNPFNQGYYTGFGSHVDDVRPQTYEGSEMYFSQPSSTTQTVSYKGNQKYNAPTQPLYYYDPNAMVMLPIYTNMIQNAYPFVENKPQLASPLVENKAQPAYPAVENKLQPAYQITENKPQSVQPQADSSKSGFNLMHILSGGSFYKGSEQAEGSQQMAVKDFIKQESNKVEKPKPTETYDKSKPPQTLMFYLNPDETPIDLKSLTPNPMQLTFGQQPQADCNSQKLKAPAVKADKLLQPIPLCSDCVPALGLMGLPSTKSAAAQQKKSITTPQVMPIWNGPNVSKLNYLILPNPITKK